MMDGFVYLKQKRIISMENSIVPFFSFLCVLPIQILANFYNDYGNLSINYHENFVYVEIKC